MVLLRGHKDAQRLKFQSEMDSLTQILQRHTLATMCRLDYTEKRLGGGGAGNRPRLVRKLRWVAKEVRRRRMTMGTREEQTISTLS